MTDYRLSKLPTMYLLDMEGKVLLATDNIGKLGDMLKKLQKNQPLISFMSSTKILYFVSLP